MKTKQFKIKSKTIVKILFIIVLLLLGFISYKYYYPDKPKLDMAAIAVNERDEIVTKVGAHIVLPSNEEPTLATVSDPDQLKKYPFFTNAQKGDKVLIYTINKKAILYRPDGDKIVEIAPLITKQSTDTGQKATNTATATLKTKNN